MKEESNLNTNCLIHTQNAWCDLGWHLKWISGHIAVGCLSIVPLCPDLCKGKGKGKVHPRKGHEGPKGK